MESSGSEENLVSKIEKVKIRSSVEPHEVQALDEFKSRVFNIYPFPDEKLLAWLRARDLNVDKAEQMLSRHLIWRRNNEISKLILWESPKNFFPYLHSGFDKDGTPVFILPIGQWDLKGCIEMGDMVPSLKFIYQTLETLVSAGVLVDMFQGVVICDFDGFSYGQIAHRTVIQGMIETVRVFEANYPEILKAAYVINAPMVFNIIYQLVKPLLHSRTLSKIQIFKNDPPKWQEALFALIPKNQLPPHWGGSKKGSDEFCSENWLSAPLPPYFFRKISTNYDEYGEEWTVIKIQGGEVLRFPFVINKTDGNGQVFEELKWSFWTEAHEIDAILVCEEKKEVVYEKRKVNCREGKKECGKFKFCETGHYKFKFDNSGSGKAKTLHYSFKIISYK